MTARLNLLYDSGACGILKLHTNLNERLTIYEFIKKSERGLGTVEIARDDYISLAHSFILFLIYSYIFQSANLQNSYENSNRYNIKRGY